MRFLLGLVLLFIATFAQADVTITFTVSNAAAAAYCERYGCDKLPTLAEKRAFVIDKFKAEFRDAYIAKRRAEDEAAASAAREADADINVP